MTNQSTPVLSPQAVARARDAMLRMEPDLEREILMSAKKKKSRAKIVRHLRFSDDDWRRVEQQAADRGITAAEFVRDIVRLHLLRDEGHELLTQRVAKVEDRLLHIEQVVSSGVLEALRKAGKPCPEGAT